LIDSSPVGGGGVVVDVPPGAELVDPAFVVLGCTGDLGTEGDFDD